MKGLAKRILSINKIVLSELKEVSDSLIAFGEIQRYERTTKS